MKKNRKFLMGLLAVVLVILAACGNSSDKSNATSENQSQNNSSSQNTNDDSPNVDSVENTTNNDNKNADTNDTESLKEEYLKKLDDAKSKVEENRKNPIDDTTFALKKVESDVYDIMDGLINEIYGVLREQLPSEEMEQLRKEQREWITYRDNTSKKESLKYEGGTMEQYEYVRVENNLTEKRCFELIEGYMK